MNKRVIIGFIGMVTTTLWADFTLQYQMPEHTEQTVQYKDAQHVLITTRDASSEESGVLLIGEKRYMVTRENGKKKYTDMDAMLEQMKQMRAMYGADPMDEDAEASSLPDFKIVKKKGSRTVAGIKGEVWTVEYSDEGRTEHTDIVVTNNRRVVNAIHKYADAMCGGHRGRRLFYTFEH